MKNKIGKFFGLLTLILIMIFLVLIGNDDYKDDDYIYMNNEPSYTVGFFDGISITLEYLDSMNYLKDSVIIQLEYMIEKEHEVYEKRLLENNQIETEKINIK